MRYLAFVLALSHVGCAGDDAVVEGCGITPGGCCEVDEDCTVLGAVQTCMVDECICHTLTGECDSCVTDEDCLREGFVCLAATEGLFHCFDTKNEVHLVIETEGTSEAIPAR